MPNEGLTPGERSSALWGKRSGSRGGGLRGKSGRGVLVVALSLIVLAGPVAPVAEAKKSARPATTPYRAFVTPSLLAAATAKKGKTFQVIVQGRASNDTRDVARNLGALLADSGKAKFKRQFASIPGVAMKLTGDGILRAARKRWVAAITPDGPIELAGRFSNKQRWAYVAGVARFWNHMDAGLQPPAIAVVDSGVEKNRADFGFGAQIRKEVVLTSLDGNSAGDGRGHGTFVAGIAAGQAPGYAGALPAAPIVSLDVMDDKGMARTSDVIAAADWILRNKDSHNIRVANFSLHSSVPNSVMYDPLNRAVEKLWFGGVVVVAAAGNFGESGRPSDMPFAPGNDPFVITVGANDIEGSVGTNDDVAAPWSAYGYTLDGFAKPDVGAPGRYLVGPAPEKSTLALERPGQVRGPGYIELSGTSFAAPVVSGIAAYLLAVNPSWTPDQVKGALMLTAKRVPSAAPFSLGVGQVDGPKAADVVNPPNPNLALNRFVAPDPSGDATPIFDAASWAHVAGENASWASASWASASWASASWASASWASASWASASWASASWASTAGAADSWAAASWASASYEDGAEGEAGVGGEIMTPEELEQAERESGTSARTP